MLFEASEEGSTAPPKQNALWLEQPRKETVIVHLFWLIIYISYILEYANAILFDCQANKCDPSVNLDVTCSALQELAET